MPTTPDTDRCHPRRLLELLEPIDPPTIVGFEPAPRHLDLHCREIPDDDRAGAGALLGVRAPRGWSAVGVTLAGTARPAGEPDALPEPASVAVVVDRLGRTASSLCHLGAPAPVTGRAPTGLVVDALHRMLGLPSPGEPPATELVVLAMWAQLVIEACGAGATPSWGDVVALHPGRPGLGPPLPSVETLVAATVDAARQLDWGRLHRRAVAGVGGTPELARHEVRWMDPTLYGRWVLGGMPDVALAATVLATCGGAGADAASRSLRAVAAAVATQLGSRHGDDATSAG